jgi:hypothetical protein
MNRALSARPKQWISGYGMSVMRIFKDSLQKIMMFAGKRKSSIAFGWHDYRNLKFVSGHNEKLRVNFNRVKFKRIAALQETVGQSS